MKGCNTGAGGEPDPPSCSTGNARPFMPTLAWMHTTGAPVTTSRTSGKGEGDATAEGGAYRAQNRRAFGAANAPLARSCPGLGCPSPEEARTASAQEIPL